MAPDDLRGAKDYALRLLGFRARSVAEMTCRLGQRGYDETTIEQVIADLSAVRLLDDEEFAQSWVADRLAGAATGRTRLLWELRRHGIAAETAAAAVDGSLSPETESEVAWEWARKRTREAPDGAELRRLQAALQRRGFGREVVREVLERLARDEDSSP